MWRRAFPRCDVSGPVDPVPFNHLGLEGAVPRKCGSCRFSFEGECTRAIEQVHGYLQLDHGPCPILGDTTPVLLDSPRFRATVSIPSKCRSCAHLAVEGGHGITCGFERERWGWFRRGFDWGDYTPELPNIGLQSGRPVSLAVLRAAASRSEAAMVRAFKADFPDSSIREARDAFTELVAQLDALKK